MPRLKELFICHNGVVASELDIFPAIQSGRIAIRCPSNSYDGTLVGYVNITDVPPEKIFPPETLMVSTDGEGSHTFSYVMADSFVPNSNVLALVPRIPMTLMEKMFYARAITLNRSRFSYGRKPKGERILSIQLPELGDIPTWVSSATVPDFLHLAAAVGTQVALPPISQWGAFRLHDLFILERNPGPSVEWAENNPGKIPLVSASKFNNGVAAWTTSHPEYKLNAGHCVTVEANGTDIGTSFYQPSQFYSTSDVVILRPREELSMASLIFIATVVTNNCFRFNYGRKFTGYRTRLHLQLPVTESGLPNLQLMHKFITGCRYSSIIGKSKPPQI